MLRSRPQYPEFSYRNRLLSRLRLCRACSNLGPAPDLATTMGALEKGCLTLPRHVVAFSSRDPECDLITTAVSRPPLAAMVHLPPGRRRCRRVCFGGKFVALRRRCIQRMACISFHTGDGHKNTSVGNGEIKIVDVPWNP